MNNPMAKAEEIKCACVHPDAYECAAIRDGIEPDDRRCHQRACECDCHQGDEDDRDDDWVNPSKRT